MHPLTGIADGLMLRHLAADSSRLVNQDLDLYGNNAHQWWVMALLHAPHYAVSCRIIATSCKCCSSIKHAVSSWCWTLQSSTMPRDALDGISVQWLAIRTPLHTLSTALLRVLLNIMFVITAATGTYSQRCLRFLPQC